MHTESEAQKKALAYSRRGKMICSTLADEMYKLALEPPVSAPEWDKASYTLIRDPAFGDESLEALWCNEHGIKVGSITFHADGSFFAEYDIVRSHPQKSQWFIEAVSAWGRDDTIKSEVRLLPMPE